MIDSLIDIGDGDVCGGFDRCWPHDTSSVNTSLCYYPCSASTSTSGTVTRSCRRLCAAQPDQAPSVEHIVARKRPTTTPRQAVDTLRSVEDRDAVLSSPVASSRAGRRPRSSPLLCLLGVAAALIAVIAGRDRLRNCDLAVFRVPLEDDVDFPAVRLSRDAGKFPLPVVNYVARNCASFDAAVSSCSRSCTSASNRLAIES